MKINVADYYTPEEWSIFKAESAQHETPFVVVNLDIIRRKYEELRKFFPFAKVYYAMKANPAPDVLTLLRDLGSCFDIASRYELDRALSLGIAPEKMSYGNTIKKISDIKYFYERASVSLPQTVRPICAISPNTLPDHGFSAVSSAKAVRLPTGPFRGNSDATPTWRSICLFLPKTWD